MITIQTIVPTSISNIHYPILYHNSTYQLEDVVFFDIETTGLQADSSMLYLIGAMTYEDDNWTITQWLADSYEDEEPMLISFYEHIKDKSLHVHFNGSTFDVPYLNKKYKHFGIRNPFVTKDSLDIYREISSLRKILPTDNLKLSTLSISIGIHRKDLYSGKELIDIYKRFIANEQLYKLSLNHIDNTLEQTKISNLQQVEEEHGYLKDILLLHNYEDIIALPSLYSLISLRDLILLPDSILDYSNTNTSYITVDNVHYNENQERIRIEIPTKCQLPMTLYKTLDIKNYLDTSSFLQAYDLPSITCDIHTDFIVVELPTFELTLKYFFKNYKDYYYLPLEDTAMHTSVAQYVDKEYRKKATPSTAYIKKDGYFLPLLLAEYKKTTHKDKDNYPSNAFFSHYEDKLFFIEKPNITDPSIQLLSQLCNNILWNCYK